MAFIVKKNISGKDYFYLNETKRVEGKVVSKCLGYLGKDRKDAEKKASEILKNIGKGKDIKKIKMAELEHTKISNRRVK